MSELRYAVVVPTLGRPSLGTLLDALAGAEGPRPEWLVLVDDRPGRAQVPVADVRELPENIARHVLVLAGRGRGPAAARNAQRTAASWTGAAGDAFRRKCR